MKMSRIFEASIIVAVAAGFAACADKEEPPQQESILGAGEIPPSPTTPTFLGDADYPRWRVAPEDEKYTAIDGVRLKTYVADQAAISHRSRERGEQWWGRIIGSEADAESAQWMAEKLREVGVPEVRIQEFDLPPQWRPVSWSVNGSLGDEQVVLESAMPFTRTAPTPSDGLDLELAYVGLGTPADGRTLGSTGRSETGRCSGRLMVAPWEGGMYYHTDYDAVATTPPSGLENTTRSYAKIIDQVNRFDRSQLVAPGVAASN